MYGMARYVCMLKWLLLSVVVLIGALSLHPLSGALLWGHAYLCEDRMMLKAVEQLDEYEATVSSFEDCAYIFKQRCFVYEGLWHDWHAEKNYRKRRAVEYLWQSVLCDLENVLDQAKSAYEQEPWYARARFILFRGQMHFFIMYEDFEEAFACIRAHDVTAGDIDESDRLLYMRQVANMCRVFYKSVLRDQDAELLITYWQDLQRIYTQTDNLPSDSACIANLSVCYGKLCNFSKRYIQTAGTLSELDEANIRQINAQCANMSRALSVRFGKQHVR